MEEFDATKMKCDACGAPLHYEPGAAVVVCRHCGMEYKLDTPVEGTIEFELVEDDEPAAAEEADDPPPAADTPAPAAPAVSPAADETALTHLLAGDKIAAIKAVRAASAMGLKEAKDYVEVLAAREGIPVPRGRGCGFMLFVAASIVITGIIAVIWWAVMH